MSSDDEKPESALERLNSSSPMIGFATIGFFFTLEPIIHGYNAGQQTLTQAFDQAEADYQAHVAKVAAGEIDDIITDEASGERFDYGDHIYHIQESAKDMLNIHRQSYAVMLHHAWEKHVCKSNGYREYRHRDAYRELSKEGWDIDEPGLERLRQTVNCIKHDGPELFNLHPEMFDAGELPDEGQKRGFQDALRLTDDDIKAFIANVKRSAQRAR